MAFKIGSVLRARCPACHRGRVNRGLFSLNPRCTECGYDFYPENGFYLGAMVVSYLMTAALTIPPVIALKLMQVDLLVLLVFPFVEFLFVGTFLMFYCRIIWLHLEYNMTSRLGGDRDRHGR